MTVSEIITEFFSKYRSYKVAKGTLLLLPGDEVKDIMFIEEGTITQFTIADNGNKVILNNYKAGAFLPMRPVVQDDVNKYYFEASSKTLHFRKAPSVEVVEFLKVHPDVMFDLLSRMLRGLDGLLQRLAEHMGGSATSRVKIELIIMAQRFGSRLEDGTYIVQTTDQALADQSGMARETVTRSLAELKRQGIVKRAPKGMIVDIDGLKNQ